MRYIKEPASRVLFVLCQCLSARSGRISFSKKQSSCSLKRPHRSSSSSLQSITFDRSPISSINLSLGALSSAQNSSKVFVASPASLGVFIIKKVGEPCSPPPRVQENSVAGTGGFDSLEDCLPILFKGSTLALVKGKEPIPAVPSREPAKLHVPPVAVDDDPHRGDLHRFS